MKCLLGRWGRSTIKKSKIQPGEHNQQSTGGRGCGTHTTYHQHPYVHHHHHHRRGQLRANGDSQLCEVSGSANEAHRIIENDPVTSRAPRRRRWGGVERHPLGVSPAPSLALQWTVLGCLKKIFKKHEQPDGWFLFWILNMFIKALTAAYIFPSFVRICHGPEDSVK